MHVGLLIYAQHGYAEEEILIMLWIIIFLVPINDVKL